MEGKETDIIFSMMVHNITKAENTPMFCCLLPPHYSISIHNKCNKRKKNQQPSPSNQTFSFFFLLFFWDALSFSFFSMSLRVSWELFFLEVMILW